jgi:hypothetical protein
VAAVNGRYRLAAMPSSGNRINTVYRHVSDVFVIIRGTPSLLAGEDGAVRWSLLDGDMVRAFMSLRVCVCEVRVVTMRPYT